MPRVLIIGGGIAGIQAALSLASMDIQVVLIEKADALGGHVSQWDRLFPSRRPAKDIIDGFLGQIDGGIRVMTGTEIIRADRIKDVWQVELDSKERLEADAILIATGFDLFEARKKEEYGYGIYDNVITSADLEQLFSQHGQFRNRTGNAIKRVGFVHCVGSRDEKVGNLYCSRVCCVTAVKQAIEIRELFPEAQVFCFYMDLRMFGIDFEALYKEAQEKWGIQFIRGRLSESFENPDGSVVVKVEDTLANKPFRMNVDLLVLMSGMVPGKGTSGMKGIFGLKTDENRFLLPPDRQLHANDSGIPGVFLAGTCTSPKSIDETLADARAAALSLLEFLRKDERSL
jgi:heterodisulfide reductase subunit A